MSRSNITAVEIFNCGFIAFLLCLCFKVQVFFDLDTAWHIKAGQFIIDNRMMPYTDPWSFTSDQEWYLLSWLWDVFAYGIYDYFGLKGILVAQALSIALLVSYAAFTLSAFKNVKPTSVFVAVAIMGVCLWPLLYFRPQLHAYLLFLLFLNAMQSIRLRWLKIGVIMLLWANIHGSFILALMVLGYYGAFALYKKDWSELKSLSLLSVIALLVTLINPYGVFVYLGVMRTIDSVITDMILEWHPYMFGSNFPFSFAVLAMAALSRYDRFVPLKDRVLAYILLAMSLVSVRNFAFFGLGALPYIVTTFDKHLEVTHNNKPFFPIFISRIYPIIFAIAFVAVLTRFSFLKEEGMVSNAPLDSINYITEHCHPGELFNDYNTGGFVIFWLADKGFHHTIDGRAGTAYSEVFLKEYLDFIWDNKSLSKISIMNDPQIALVSNYLLAKANIAKHFEKWDNAFTGATTSVYVKSGSSACRVHN